jgi:AcrR family transcriptional regulator
VDQEKPRTRRHRRTQQAILDAAREIIRDEGIDALSMRAIADRIDYSAATLYEYFASKEEIVEVVSMQGQQMLYDYLAQVDTEKPLLEYFEQLGLAYIRFALENPDYFLTMFTYSATRRARDTHKGPPPPHEGSHDSAYTILLDAIRRGIHEGIFQPRPGLDVMEMAYAAWSVVHGISMLRVAHMGHLPLDFEHMDRQVLKVLARGLQA